MKNSYTQQIMDLMNKFKGDDEISSNQYPEIGDELKRFLSNYGFYFY